MTIQTYEHPVLLVEVIGCWLLGNCFVLSSKNKLTYNNEQMFYVGVLCLCGLFC